LVKAVAVQVTGKRDPTPVTLYLWRDDAVPELDPVAGLLLWIYISKIQSGYLFPDLTSVQDGSVSSSHCAYETFQQRFKKLCLDCTRRTGPFGTHTLRKTGFLLGVWGGAVLVDLMNSARHKTISNAKRYIADSSCLLEVAKADHPVLAGLVPQFKSIFVQETQMARNLGGRRRTKAGLPLHALANDWICSFIPNSSDRSWKNLLELVSLRPKILTLEDRIMSLIKEVSDADWKTEITIFLNEWKTSMLLNQAARVDTDDLDVEMETNPLIRLVDGSTIPYLPDLPTSENVETLQIGSEEKRETAPSIPQPSKNRKKRSSGIGLSLTAIENLRKLKGVHKLDMIIQLHQEYEEIGSRELLNNSCRSLVNETILPVMHCYKNHCGENKKLFLAKWDNFKHHSKFNKKCGANFQVCQAPSRE
jgi:hypothetical protein